MIITLFKSFRHEGQAVSQKAALDAVGEQCSQARATSLENQVRYMQGQDCLLYRLKENNEKASQ
jgi:hypothetical protein